MKTKEEILPKGWRSNEFNDRRDAIKLLPKRVRVLLSAEWARSVIRIYDEKYARDDRPLKAIESAESWVKAPNAANAANAAYAANAAANAANAAYAAYAANAAANAATYAADAADAAAATYADAAAATYADAADAAATYTTYTAAATADAADAADAAAAAKWKWLYKTYKYCKGSDNVFDDNWKTDTCIALARNIYDTRDFSSMPILADALQDAGYDCDDMLNHLRHDYEYWTRACWAIWNLLELGNDL